MLRKGKKKVVREDNRHYESDGDYVYSEYNRYASRMENLFREDNSFWPDFMHELGGTQVPSQGLGGTQVPSSGGGTDKIAQTQKMTNKPFKGKRKRHSGGQQS